MAGNVLSHWYGVCERMAHGPFSEPLNVVSSVLFMIVSVATYRYYHRNEDIQRRWVWDIHALTFLTFIIGLNSAVFHSFPSPTTELLDTIPIVMFIMIYFTSVLFRIGRCSICWFRSFPGR
jgi:hypothetical protein